MHNRFATPLVVALTTAITGIAWAGQQGIALTLTSCKTGVACVTATNKSTGPAILGTATAGTGVLATTSGAATTAGVEGSASSSGTGIVGKSTSGDGIQTASTKSEAISAISYGANPAISGTAASGATSAGVEGVAPKGTGISGEGPEAFAGSGQFTTTAAAGSTGALFSLLSAPLGPGKGGTHVLLPPITVFSVDQAGDVFFNGPTVACAAYTTVYACRALNLAPSGAAVRPAAPRVATPGGLTVRVVRFGQARLIAGSARVALDPAVAGGLTDAHAYHVLLSDAGASASWLYVADKSAGSFLVREHGGGRSSGTFGYRIMADVRPPARAASNVKGVF
jgi:hypothetical protein